MWIVCETICATNKLFLKVNIAKLFEWVYTCYVDCTWNLCGIVFCNYTYV